MGADLYIRSLSDIEQTTNRPLFDKWVAIRNKSTDEKEKEYAQKKVDEFYAAMYAKGYYRDSYNGSNALNRLGLSWWQDVGKLINKKGFMSPRNVKKFLALIESREVKPVTAAWLKKNYCRVDDNENSVDAWNKGYWEHKDELVTFLKTAIRLNEAIDCSI